MQALRRRRWAMLCVLVLGFGGAGMTGACGAKESAPVDACLTPTDTPTEDTSTECAEPISKPCMLYRIPLMGDPNMNLALRNKYIAALGSACYMSVANTFDCFYEKIEDACAYVAKVPGVFGAAPYEEG